MNEIKIVFSDMEMVSHLRGLGFIIEERRVEKWAANESYSAWVWQIQKNNGKWADALPIYHSVLQFVIKRSLIGAVTKLDLLNLIK